MNRELELFYKPGKIPNFKTENKKLTSWIYATISKPLILGGQEYDVGFISNQLDGDALKCLMNVYLNILQRDSSNFEVLENLKSDDESFDAEKVMNAISFQLQNNFSEASNILDIFRMIYSKDNSNEIENQLNEPFFKRFCDGLELSKPCRVLFFLGLINSVYKWIFPNEDKHEYNSRIFCWLLDEDVTSEMDLAQKTNHKLIEKGLFCDNWTVHGFIISAFTGRPSDCVLQRVRWSEYGDIYDYQKVYKDNEEETKISFNLLRSFSHNSKNCIQLISAAEDTRAKLYLNNNIFRLRRNLYEISVNSFCLSKEEVEFFVYVYSLTLSQVRSVIYIGEPLSSAISSQSDKKSLLKFVKVPVFMYAKNVGKEKSSDENEERVEIWNTLNIRFYDSAIDTDNPKKFFCYMENTEYIKATCDFVLEQKIDPKEWNRIMELGKASTLLSVEEFKSILEKNYPNPNKTKLRKNPHYSFDALNISKSPEEILKCVKRAIEFQEREYNADSGWKVLCKGPSGTGKTAIVEEISKVSNRPLKIVTASDFLGKFVGETEQNIKAIFDEAAETHSILLVDEADSMIHSRGDTVNKHNDSKVNEFITQMERFPGILFCNTNFPESLDKATDRRFDLKIDFKPLTKNGIEKLVEAYFEEYHLSSEQINKIFDAGEVTPGDFNVINRQIRFMDSSDITADFITSELCNVVSGKVRSFEHKIGFGN